jgi:hypothetical protein
MPVNHLPPDHEAHDELLIVAFASGDASGEDAATAAGLVASCASCRRLLDDIGAIAAATAELPAPERPRDFRLTDADAARLGRTGWRRLLGPLAGPRLRFAGSLGGALVTLGLAGLLVATVPSVLRPAQVALSNVGTSVGAPEAAPADRAAGAAASSGGVTSAGEAPLLNVPSAASGVAASPLAAGSAGDTGTAGKGASAAPGSAQVPAPAPTSGVTGLDASGAGPGSAYGTDAATATAPSTAANAGGLDPGALLAGASLIAILLGIALLALRRSAGRVGGA